LIENFGAPIDLLVAHDWGGAVAWNLAAQRPHLLKRLLIINSPHPATFLRELRDNPAQQQASSYMTFLCRPDAEALLAANDHERLWKMLTRSSATAPAWASETLRQRYREVWSMGLSGALNFYRASPLRPPVSPDDPLMSLQLPDEAVTVRVPTTVLWGEGDVALLPGLLDGLERWVPDLRVLRVPDATHWIVHERPDWVGAQISHALGLAPDAQTTT
jgi:pimeloyl-ACP methyl ester carboxylesterase